MFSHTPIDWVSFLDNRFYNALLIEDLQEISTFRHNDNIYSTIDYIFVSNALCNQMKESDIHKLDPTWTDHSILSTQLTMGISPTGPGLWRAKPILVLNLPYQRYLQQQLQDILLQTPSVWTPQTKWDHVKTQVKKVTRNFAIQYTDWRRTTIRQLQGDHNRFLRSKPPRVIRIQRLTDLDQQIASLQNELTEILALKSNVRRCEEGETSVKYLKSMYRTRSLEQHIATLRPSDSNDPVDDIDQLLPMTQQFYQSLYHADPVDDNHIHQYLVSLQNVPKLAADDHDSRLAPITIDEILAETRRVVNKVSSPREDGLGYALLYQLFRYPPLQPIVVEVFNDALSLHTFSSSWQELRVRLLSKKGDLTSLKNWHPILLINCDAKLLEEY